MSTIKKREAGKRAFPKDTLPALRLARPSAECATADFTLNAAREMKEMLREMNRKLRVVLDINGPDAA